MRGHKPPGHPPALNLGASDRRLPAGDGSGPTHQGKGRGGPGGLRVGRPCFPSCKRERETQEARGSKEKISPPPTRETRGNHRENAARGTHPPRGKRPREPGEGKNTARGAPPTQKKEKNATRQRRNRRRKATKRLGVPRLVKGVQAEAGPRQRELVLAESLRGALPPQSRQHTKRNKSSNTRTSTILSSLSCRSSSCRRKKTKSSGRCTPHPGGDQGKDQNKKGKTRPEA